MQVAQQPCQNCLETSAKKFQAGVRFFWNITMFRAKLASVNANHRNIVIFHHVTFGTNGLLLALFEMCIDIAGILGPSKYCAACTVTVPVPPLLSPSLPTTRLALACWLSIISISFCAANCTRRTHLAHILSFLNALILLIFAVVELSIAMEESSWPSQLHCYTQTQ